MKFEIADIKVKPGKLYRGWITGHHIDQDKRKLYIEVELDKSPGTKFLKVVPIDLNPQSTFCRLGYALDILDEDGYIETEYLKDIAVMANLREGNDMALYINHLELDEAYYQQLDADDEYDDDEIYYGDDE